MSGSWYSRIKNDLTLLPECLIFYQSEYEQARREVRLTGAGVLEKAASSIPHVLEHRFAQLQDIEAVLKYLNIQYEKTRSEVFQSFFLNLKSARALTARECEKFVDSDDTVVSLAELVNDVSYVRNLYLSIMKGLDAKAWQINNIVKLQCAGLTDATI